MVPKLFGKLADSQFGVRNYDPGTFYRFRIKETIKDYYYQNDPGNNVTTLVPQRQSG